MHFKQQHMVKPETITYAKILSKILSGISLDFYILAMLFTSPIMLTVLLEC